MGTVTYDERSPEHARVEARLDAACRDAYPAIGKLAFLGSMLQKLCISQRNTISYEIEYGTDRGNTWVPYPFTFAQWEKLAELAGFVTTRLLSTVPSRWLGTMYSAVSEV